MIDFIYLCILLFVIIFICYLLKKSIKICPNKIKVFYFITFVVIIVRYLSLILGQTIQVQRYIYLIKFCMMLNYYTMPLLALVALYIFFRDENRKFDYNFTFMILLAVIYIVLIYIYKLDINIDIVFGFVVSFKNYLIPSLIYLITLSTLAVIALLFIDKPYSNRGGMIILTISLMMAIIEFVLYIGNIKVFPYPLFGEIIMLITSYKAIETFSKSKR